MRENSHMAQRWSHCRLVDPVGEVVEGANSLMGLSQKMDHREIVTQSDGFDMLVEIFGNRLIMLAQ